MSNDPRAVVAQLVPLAFVREHIEGLELRGVVGVFLVYDDLDRARRDAAMRGSEEDAIPWDDECC